MNDNAPNARTGMENAKTADPLNPEAGSASQNSRQHASTAIQSEVTPEAYPAFEREAQVEQATGRPAGEKPKAG
jgi:hypothetical protein